MSNSEIIMSVLGSSELPLENKILVSCKDESTFEFRMARAQKLLVHIEHNIYECTREIAEKLGLSPLSNFNI